MPGVGPKKSYSPGYHIKNIIKNSPNYSPNAAAGITPNSPNYSPMAGGMSGLPGSGRISGHNSPVYSPNVKPGGYMMNSPAYSPLVN